MDYLSFFSAFQKAYGLKQASWITSLEDHYLGHLVITSGKLIACDPWFAESAFSAKPIAPGQYPVVVLIAHFSDDSDQRVALAGTIFRESQPVKWKNAIPIGENYNEANTYYYGVDSGTGCFMDEETASAFYTSNYKKSDTPFEDPLQKELEKPGQYIPTWSWANYCVNPETGANIIAFSSGYGDGGYPSYFGYDEEENIVCIITDFEILER